MNEPEILRVPFGVSAMRACEKPGRTGLSFQGTRRLGFFLLGVVMLGLGIVGAFVPVMPTTIFLILALWFFSRSSPRLEAWMLNHPRFGGVLRNWRAEGAVPRNAKIMACGGMAFGYVVFLVSAKPALWLAFVVGVFAVGSAVYVVTRPAPKLPL